MQIQTFVCSMFVLLLLFSSVPQLPGWVMKFSKSLSWHLKSELLCQSPESALLLLVTTNEPFNEPPLLEMFSLLSRREVNERSNGFTDVKTSSSRLCKGGFLLGLRLFSDGCPDSEYKKKQQFFFSNTKVILLKYSF